MEEMLKAMAILFVSLFVVSVARAEMVKGPQVAERTTKVLTKIDWTHDLSTLLEKAKQEKKLAFWLQLVGDLDGGL